MKCIANGLILWWCHNQRQAKRQDQKEGAKELDNEACPHLGLRTSRSRETGFYPVLYREAFMFSLWSGDFIQHWGWGLSGQEEGSHGIFRHQFCAGSISVCEKFRKSASHTDIALESPERLGSRSTCMSLHSADRTSPPRESPHHTTQTWRRTVM